jgi:formylglycine-generating enzyme required for sulfatase activity
MNSDYRAGRFFTKACRMLKDDPCAMIGELKGARSQTDALFELIHPDAFYARPIPERHRIIFYLGHLEAFDWNLIARGPLDLPAFHPSFDRLFAFGIDPDSSEQPQDAASDWPAVDEIRSYNRRVREALDERVGEIPERLLHVAIEHRLMHAETFAFMLHNLPAHWKRGTPVAAAAAPDPPKAEMLEVPAGPVTLGLDAGEGFGWDNEFAQHAVDVPGFALGKHKVTNAEYLEFVRQGGPVPHFWQRERGAWQHRGMFGTFPLPPAWPVYVTHEQATAYAAWRGKRLPSEAEFHRAAYPAKPRPEADNFNFCSWEPGPVQAGTANARGFVQMIGNGWEWTSTLFHPFPGFQSEPFYPNYSEPFFDGNHYVLKGASPRTAARLTRPSFRNWFRPAYPYVYAAFRLAESR